MTGACVATPPLVPAGAPAYVLAADVRTILPRLDLVDLTISDPPYPWFTALQRLEREHGTLGPPETLYPVYTFLAQWFPFVLRRTTRAVWITTHRLYVPFYRALVPARAALGVWPTGVPDVCLLHVGPPLRAAPSPAVRALHRSGQDSPEAFWAALLALTPGTPPGLVFDPFCGTGSGLSAARRAGYRALGCEQDAAVLARLRLAQPAFVIGPAGPSQESDHGSFAA